MPELPEVERAAALLRTLSKGKKITKVDAVEDTIVFTGTTHTEFVKEIEGRTVKDVARYGKVFYVELSGPGKMPVLHFGMTGMLQVKGQLPIHYREAPKKASVDWPPRFMKFVLHIQDTETDTCTEVAFLDARRLGRIRLVKSPLTEPPISTLGFDPILSMPGLEDFSSQVLKRTYPIKALLLDQTFSAGVGNWVADEILYHARIHPERRCNTLSEGELDALHMRTRWVCKTAVDVNADDSQFPENWLFRHRWGKGKKKKHELLLPGGEPATIKWVTVGGRTSAYVVELQALSGEVPVTGTRRTKRVATTPAEPNEDDDGDSELTPLEESGGEEAPKRPSRKRKASQHKVDVGTRPTRGTRKKT